MKTNRARSRDELEHELIDTGVFDDDRYFDVFVEYAKAAPERHPHPDQRRQPRPGAATAARPADALVSQHLVRAGCIRSPASRWRRARRRRARSRRRITSSGGRWLSARATRRCSSPRTRPTSSALFGGAERRAATSRTASTTTSSTGEPSAVNPAQDRDQGRGALPGSRSRPARRAVAAPAAARTRAGRWRDRSRGFDDVVATRLPRGRRASTTPSRRRRCRRGRSDSSCARRSRACCGASSTTSSTSTPGSRSTARIRCAACARPDVRNADWFHMSTTTSSRCPTSGSTPGTPPGISPSTPLALVDGRPRLRQAAARAHAARRYLHPNGQIPAYEWNFGDVNPPVHAWATLFIYQIEKARSGARRSSLPAQCLPQAAAQLHLVAQPQGPRRQQRLRGRLPRPRQHRRVRSQRAAADRRLPRAGRRHRLDGASSRQNMLEIALELAPRRPASTRTGAAVLRALPLDRRRDGPHRRRNDEMWDEEDGFFYDVLRAARRQRDAAEGALDGRPAAAVRRHRRSSAAAAGALPAACASASQRFLEHHPELVANIAAPDRPGVAGRASAARC